MSNEKYVYTAVCHNGRWMIEVTDQDGGTDFMTCGVAPTEAEVQARIGWLRLDDDKIDAARGAARKYQS
jgi:hypothetical protein